MTTNKLKTINKKIVRLAIRSFFLCLLVGSILVLGAYFLPGSNSTPFKDRLKQISPESYLKLRNAVLEYNKEIGGIAERLDLPEFRLTLSRDDVVHFTELYHKLKNEDRENYIKANTWRKAKLYYDAKQYDIKIKMHGKSPDGHKKGKFISYAVKLKKSDSIFGATKFSLIIWDRIPEDYKLVSDLANEMDIIKQSEQLINLKINSWEPKLYYFEKEINDEYLEFIGKSSFRSFEFDEKADSSDKALILYYENGDVESFEEQSFMEKMDQVFDRTKYTEPHIDAIKERYLSLNKTIHDNDDEKILEYFDLDYISSYLATRLLLGLNWHGINKSNLRLLYDSSSGKFYPTLRRDEVPTKLSNNFTSPEEQLNIGRLDDGTELSFRMMHMLFRNDKIRQRTYEKVYYFLSGDIDIISQRHIDLMDEEYKKHYVGWLKYLLGKIGFYHYGFIDNNAEYLRNYLSDLFPQIEWNFDGSMSFAFFGFDEPIVVNDIYQIWKKQNPHIRSEVVESDYNKEIIIKRGTYSLEEDLVIPSPYKLVIEAGTKFLLYESISIFAYKGLDVRGTRDNPVVIRAVDSVKPYGTVGILGTEETISTINYLYISNGSEAWHEGAYFSGSLSIHNNGLVKILNSNISGANADDGLNVKNSYIIMGNNNFSNNYADHVDLDYCKGLVFSSSFVDVESQDPNGDALDISGSSIILFDSSFDGFADKGLSIGEESGVVVLRNKFFNNSLGIAVKDLSDLYLGGGNIFDNNKTDISVYLKKAIFGGGAVWVLQGNLPEVELNYILDNNSRLHFLSEEAVDIFQSIYQDITEAKINNIFFQLSEVKKIL